MSSLSSLIRNGPGTCRRFGGGFPTTRARGADGRAGATDRTCRARSWARLGHARRHRRDAVPTRGDPRVPRPPPTPRLDRKKHRLDRVWAVGSAKRNMRCRPGADPRSAPRALFPRFHPGARRYRWRREGFGGMTHHFALVLVADGDVGVLHGDVLLDELALGLLGLGLSLGDGARDDGAAGDDLLGLGGAEAGLMGAGSGCAVSEAVRRSRRSRGAASVDRGGGHEIGPRALRSDGKRIRRPRRPAGNASAQGRSGVSPARRARWRPWRTSWRTFRCEGRCDAVKSARVPMDAHALRPDARVAFSTTNRCEG